MIEYDINYETHNFNYIKPIGDKVLLKKLVNKLTKTCGDILIPDEINKNHNFGIAQVIDLGTSESIKDSGLKINDYVLYDYYSVYNDNPEYVITKIENIVLQLTEEEANKLVNTRISF